MNRFEGSVFSIVRIRDDLVFSLSPILFFFERKFEFVVGSKIVDSLEIDFVLVERDESTVADWHRMFAELFLD